MSRLSGGTGEEYVAAVLDVVARIPPGRVMTYGLIAEVVAEGLAARGGEPRGGPRQVGAVLSRHGGTVPWWRVVAADGRVPAHKASLALEALRSEGTPFTSDDDDARVLMRSAVWWPQ